MTIYPILYTSYALEWKQKTKEDFIEESYSFIPRPPELKTRLDCLFSIHILDKKDFIEVRKIFFQIVIDYTKKSVQKPSLSNAATIPECRLDLNEECHFYPSTLIFSDSLQSNLFKSQSMLILHFKLSNFKKMSWIYDVHAKTSKSIALVNNFSKKELLQCSMDLLKKKKNPEIFSKNCFRSQTIQVNLKTTSLLFGINAHLATD